MILSAPPSFKTHFAELFRQAASNITMLDSAIRIELARTKQASHGDYSCNLAMHLAKSLHKNPREVAQLLIDNLPVSPYIEKIEVAGAGFINLFLKHSAKQHYLQYVLQNKDRLISDFSNSFSEIDDDLFCFLHLKIYLLPGDGAVLISSCS